MRSSERALATLSTTVVLLWLGGYLAWAGYGAGHAPPQADLSKAPVRATAPPEPLPPKPILAEIEPQRAPEPEVEKTGPEPVGEAGLALGRELLASGGAFPALNATYEDFGSFREYARSMLALGAHFVVVRDNRIVGAADIETATLSEFELGAAYSPIPRDYSHEPALARVGRAVREHHGLGARVKMLLPRDLDAGLFGGIAEALAARGEDPGGYTEIQGRYEPAGNGGVWFRVESGTRADGSEVPLSRVLDLSALARGGPRA